VASASCCSPTGRSGRSRFATLSLLFACEGEAILDQPLIIALLPTGIRKHLDAGKDLQTTVNTPHWSAFARLANYDDLKGTNANRVYRELGRDF